MVQSSLYFLCGLCGEESPDLTAGASLCSPTRALMMMFTRSSLGRPTMLRAHRADISDDMYRSG
jgi:hypothetical protein